MSVGVQGRGGGERVLQVFEEQLPQAMNAQPFAQLLAIQSVKRIIQDSDGYQPFLVAPENGYRALVREGVKLMEQPAAAAVDAVDMVLRDIGQKVLFMFTAHCFCVRKPSQVLHRGCTACSYRKVSAVTTDMCQNLCFVRIVALVPMTWTISTPQASQQGGKVT